MIRFSRLCLHALCMAGLLAVPATAKQPVFSMEVAAVNGVPVNGGPARHIEVLPGDMLTLQVYLRNWSPSGELISAYQMQLEPMDFASGSAGQIRPVEYQGTKEMGKTNSDNCFVDQSNPEWIFFGRQTITLVDTRSAGYRWMSVLVEPDDNILNEQDDKKYYTGTVYMKVSDDAQGTVTIGFMEVQTSTLILDQGAAMIEPIEFETLTIVVQPDVFRILDRLNGSQDIPLEPADFDRDGKVGANDLRQAITQLNVSSTQAVPE